MEQLLSAINVKNKVLVCRGGKVHVRRYGRALKVPHALSSRDLLARALSAENKLFAMLKARCG